MSKPHQLTVSGLGTVEVRLTPEALAERTTLLENAALVLKVGDAEEQKEAVTTVASLKAFAREVENTRKALKSPILEAGKLLDATAEKAVENVNKETKRIEGLLIDFQREQIRAQQEALRLQREAQEKAQREAQEREQKLRQEAEAAERERKRLEAELEQAKGEAAKAEAAQRLAEAEAAELVKELAREFEQPVAPVFVPPPPQVEKPKGAAVKAIIRFEVLDIKALYAAHPQCVNLVPNVAAINYLLNTPGTDLTKIPGVRAWEDLNVQVRAAQAKPAIEESPFA